MDKQIRAARADLARLEREYGAAAADSAERRRPTMRGFKIAHGRLGKQLRTARARVAQLFEQRRGLPRASKSEISTSGPWSSTPPNIKMVAYQAESDLVALLRPHYARADQEGRTLLHELFATAVATEYPFRCDLEHENLLNPNVHDYPDLWSYDGTLDPMHHALYVACREQENREASPTVAIIDSQSVKSAEKGGPASIRLAMTRARRSRARSAILS